MLCIPSQARKAKKNDFCAILENNSKQNKYYLVADGGVEPTSPASVPVRARPVLSR